MPGKTDLSELNCSLARTLDVVGDWWTLLIIRDAFLGVRRFGDFQNSLGIAKNILATRLERLIESGIMARGGSEARPTYQLTRARCRTLARHGRADAMGRQMGVAQHPAGRGDRREGPAGGGREAEERRRRCRA